MGTGEGDKAVRGLLQSPAVSRVAGQRDACRHVLWPLRGDHGSETAY